MLDAPKYYRQTMEMYRGAPIHVDDASYQVLMTLCKGENILRRESKGVVYANNWNVNCDFIYHRHAEIIGAMNFLSEPGVLEWTVEDGACTLCGEKVPGEVKLLHKFYSF